MPPSVEQQLELPHIEIVGADSIKFPRLDLDDLMGWAVEVKRVRLTEAAERLAKVDRAKMDEFEKQRLLQVTSDEGIQIQWLLAKVHEPAGIRKALVMSLTKGGMPPDQILATLKRIHFQRQRVIAIEVVSPPPPPDAPQPTGQGGSDFTSPETGPSIATSPGTLPADL